MKEKESKIDSYYLEKAEMEIALVADTHFTDAQMRGGAEFPSRGRQSERSSLALDLLEEEGVDLKLHMGDLVQEYPEMEEFVPAYEAALSKLASAGRVHLVAGNHDVGDKPDGTMPAHPVNAATLEWFEERMGRSWYEVEAGNCRVLVINSQILNSGLEAEEHQARWLEEALEKSRGKRLFLFFHLPLYLWNEEEPAMGHYDVLGEPARGWLIQLIRKYGVELAGGRMCILPFSIALGSAGIFSLLPAPLRVRGLDSSFRVGRPLSRAGTTRESWGFTACAFCRTERMFILSGPMGIRSDSGNWEKGFGSC